MTSKLPQAPGVWAKLGLQEIRTGIGFSKQNRRKAFIFEASEGAVSRKTLVY